jgi:hypothetical protein
MNLLRFETILESKNGQRFSYTCSASSPDEAIDISLAIIKEKGWDRFEYKFYSSRKI